jgi:hypothetical protein
LVADPPVLIFAPHLHHREQNCLHVLSEVEFPPRFDLEKVGRLGSTVGFTDRCKTAYGKQRFLFGPAARSMVIVPATWFLDRLREYRVGGYVRFD